jgi:hypothetical protein
MARRSVNLIEVLQRSIGVIDQAGGQIVFPQARSLSARSSRPSISSRCGLDLTGQSSSRT